MRWLTGILGGDAADVGHGDGLDTERDDVVDGRAGGDLAPAPGRC